MVGAVAGFKQQNAASGLPLRLLPEELELALDRGWARGYRLRGEGSRSTTGVADPFLGDAAEVGGGGGEGGGAGDGGGEARAEDGGGGGGEKRKEEDPSPWREALAQGTHLTLATAAPESLRVYLDRSSSENPPRAASRAAAASRAVFRDLHARGFCLTPGANFGAHWLAYPSDPMLYHAQLCVRVCAGAGGEEEEGEEEEGEEASERKGSSSPSPSSSSARASSAPLCPTLLAAASRGAHAARKHLLLAYPSGGRRGEASTVHYLTIAPEAGFG